MSTAPGIVNAIPVMFVLRVRLHSLSGKGSLNVQVHLVPNQGAE